MSALDVVSHASAGAFLQRAGPFLAQSEAENVLLLGIAGEIERDASVWPGARFHTVEDAKIVKIAAMLTPPHQTLLSRGPAAAVGALVAAFVDKEEVPGVNGPAAAADEFARQWTERTGMSARHARNLRVYSLTHVVPPRETPGELRGAREREVPLLAAWMDEFAVETGTGERGPGVAGMQKEVARERLFVWDDGGPVSLSSWSGQTPSGVRINRVYTPPELRGRGYASASVAGLSQSLLEGGRKFCALFTDLGDPVANRVYARIGYEQVADFAKYQFASREVT